MIPGLTRSSDVENSVTLTTHFRFELTRKSVDNQLVSLVSADRIKVVRATGYSYPPGQVPSELIA